MKKLIAVTVAAGLTLAGCNSFNPTTVVTNSSVVATDVANATKAVCGLSLIHISEPTRPY